MLQKIAMTRRFICHHGMLQPLRWLDVTSTVVVGQRCHFCSEKCNKFTVPQVTHGRSSHLEGHLTQQPWMRAGYCQVRGFGDVCAPRVAAQTDLGSVFTDTVVWQVYPVDADVSDEKQDDLRIRNGLQNSDKKPVRGRGRPGRIVKWTNLLTSQAGSFPSMAAAARELGVSDTTVARSCRSGSQIGDYKVGFVARPELDCEQGLHLNHLSTQDTERKIWMVSNYGRFRGWRGGLTRGSLLNSGYRRVWMLGEGFSVHRVVLLTFRGPPPSSSAWQVHHRDGDSSNNRVENLTYVTSAQNNKSSYDNPERGSASPAISQPVYCKNLRTSKIVLYPSVAAAAMELGVSWWKVARSCRKGTRFRDYELEFAPPTEPEILEGEQWRPMVNPVTGLDVPGRQVSSHGRLKSAKDLIITGHRSKSGYVRAIIGSRSSAQCIGIHRLVARAFLGPLPSPQHTEVNHKDLDRGNNRVENLEYVTTSQNQQHYQASRGLAPANHSKAVLGRRHGTKNEWLHYPSMRKAAEVHGVSPSAISQCVRGLIKHVWGYEFRYARSQEPADLPGEEWRPVDLEVLRRDKAERKGRSKQGRNGGKTST